MTKLKRLLSGQAMTALAAMSLLISCSEGEAGKEDLLEPADTIKTSVVNVAGELFSVPSPVQTALLLSSTLGS